MELAFQQTPLVFMKQICQEVYRQEETGETIVPDSYPDIETIVDAYALTEEERNVLETYMGI